jgi:2-polyprenyl-3-methyl-5-hydroxy-6-metoxy-1,4-benzoquinol methylase
VIGKERCRCVYTHRVDNGSLRLAKKYRAMTTYDGLRERWKVVPAGQTATQDSTALLSLSDDDLLAAWQASFDSTSTGAGYGIRGWYHDIYRDHLRGLNVLDVGCGFAASSLYFAEHGAQLTFADIVSDNVSVVRRLCAIKNIQAEFLYIEDERSFAALRNEFDFVLALGSLINAPREVIRDEIQAILPHLKDGARWLHLAYPKARWVREGGPPFSEWGNLTDGPGTPWMEYHERDTLQFLFAPSRIEIVFDCEWHDHDFNLFDLMVHR